MKAANIWQMKKILDLLCNYDPDIIPFLNAEYGKAYYRDEQGIFREAENSEEG